MDTVSAAQLTAVLSRLADGALAEAGKQAWESLVRLVGRAWRAGSRAPEGLPGEALATEAVTAPGEAMAALLAQPGDPAQAAAAGQAVARLAAADPEFAAVLRQWWTSADHLIRAGDSGSLNIIRGDVHGPVVQARDIHGSISFGEGRPAN